MKKLVCTLAAVLLVSLFCASALAAIPVNANVAALIGEDGTVIVEPANTRSSSTSACPACSPRRRRTANS